MSDKYVFYNNYRSELADTLLIAAATANVIDAGGLETPPSGYTLLATITNPEQTLFEVVKITAVSSLEFEIERAQEGTTAVEWPGGSIIYCDATAGMLGSFAQGFDDGGDAKGANAINLQRSRNSSDQVASGADSLLIGNNATASGVSSTAVGHNSLAMGTNAAAFGDSSVAVGDFAVAAGTGAVASGANSVAIGLSSNVTAEGAVGVGQGAQATGQDAIALGNTASSSGGQAIGPYANAGDSGIALGTGADASASGSPSVAVGTGASAAGVVATAVGFSASAGGMNSLAAGQGASAPAASGAGLGDSSLANRVGQTGLPRGSATKQNSGFVQCVVQTINGSATTFVDITGGNYPITVPQDHSLAFRGVVIAQKTDQSKNAMWTIEGIIKNDSGTTTLVYSDVAGAGKNDNSDGWTLALTADDTNDCLQIQLTAEATVNASASLHVVEQSAAVFTA